MLIDIRKIKRDVEKTIFFVVDESSAYIKCFDKERPKHIDAAVLAQPHLWWLDNNMLNVIKDSDIDYLIWMCPYKRFESEIELNFPQAMIYEVKKVNYDKSINYNKDDIESIEL